MKLHPQARIKPLSKGDTRIGSAGFWNELIKTCNAFRGMRVKSGSKNDFVISDENAELTIIGTDGSGNGGGWHWAHPKEFDAAKAYAVDEAVYVGASNPAIASGASAGVFVCVKTVTGGVTGQLPIDPLPDSDPDGATNYWIPLGAVSESGWNFASPIEFSASSSYAKGEVVIVSPGNSAIASGGTAGMFVCVKSVTGSSVYQLPVWPLPDSDPDGTSNYWMLICFYPTRMTYCQSGVDVDYYVNAQPVP